MNNKSELEEFIETLNVQFDKLEGEILYQADITRISRYKSRMRNLSMLIESYEIEINYICQYEDDAYKIKHHDQARAFNQRYQKLQSELGQKINTPPQQDQTPPKEDKPPPKEDQKPSPTLADQINCELDKQIAQLDRINEFYKDTQYDLKRQAKYIKYFARQVYRDQLLMCLIALIVIAIVVLIILSALGFDNGKFQTPGVVKGYLAQKSSSSSNTTTTI